MNSSGVAGSSPPAINSRALAQALSGIGSHIGSDMVGINSFNKI
jgi:hypothetical protein